MSSRFGFAMAANVFAATALLVAPAATSAAPANVVTDTPAASLRVSLDRLGEEHVYLAGAALSAVVAGRTDEATVASGAVDKNTQEIGDAVGSIYGRDAEEKFLQLWRAHIGFFAEYAKAAAAHDDAGKQQALNNLNGYRQDIDDLLTGANPNLPKGSVAQLFAPHVQHLTGAIDALAANDPTTAYAMLHMAAHQSQEIMDPLASAIVQQFPDKFAGDPLSSAATLRANLNDLGDEHVYLAGYAFNAAIAGRGAEFEVASQTVDQNTQEIGAAVGSVYGPDAQQKFLQLWRAHIGFFGDYAKAAVANDSAGRQTALRNLDGYRQSIDDFLTGANPNLPRGSVAQLFVPHVQHLTMVIDDLAGHNVPAAYDMLHMAAHQSQEIMDPLASAIVQQFPDKFSSGAVSNDPTVARDGRRLDREASATQAMFQMVWGSRAASEWATEHNAVLGR